MPAIPCDNGCAGSNLIKMKRRSFIKKVGLTAGTIISAPYILPSGRLFANTGARVVNHVVFVLFGGGIRNQEAVEQAFVAHQPGQSAEGNIMRNMLDGAPPTEGLDLFNYAGGNGMWNPVLSEPLSKQGAYFKEVLYREGPTGHYNGHTVAMTGVYTETGLNLNVNPEFPTVFEYYRKHSDPAQSALNAWWISEGLGPYPSLNYSRYPGYGAAYGANYMRPLTLFAEGMPGFRQLKDAVLYQPDDVARIDKVKSFLDRNFENNASELPGIQNPTDHREAIKAFYLETLEKVKSGTLEFPTPNNNPNLLTGDLMALTGAWEVLNRFAPELTVVNTTNLDICHSNFTGYLNFLHRADYGVGWLWNKIQNHPVLANDTIMVCIPEHGRNLAPNNLKDNNNLLAFDHTGDDNSRRVFSLIVGPEDKVVRQTFGTDGMPAAESVDIVPTIAHILGFYDDMPHGLLNGRVLTEAFL
ncbi:MAG: hypothetical protein D6714_04900 [Bacteroidetes bacterium]|nr:MAG: hypothetical protein D6714_04900 [Bacteroidota bacterium]